MEWETFRPQRAAGTCLILLTFSFLLMTFRLTKNVQVFRSFLFYWVSPSQETAINLIGFSKNLGSRMADLIQADHENVLLRERAKRLSLIEDRYRELLLENQRLKQILNLKSSLPFDIVPARVSGRDTQNWTSAVWIDRGSQHNIRPNSPVLAIMEERGDQPKTSAGVVGRVLECGLSSSKVLLISDPLSSIAVSFPRTGEQGLVAGQGSFSILVDYLDPASDTQVGDEIVTSGLGGIFPAGLSVGQLSNVTPSSSWFKNAELKPTVPLNKIREVLVLNLSNSALPYGLKTDE